MAYIKYAAGVPGQNCRVFGEVPSMENADIQEGEVAVPNPSGQKCKISADGLSAEPWEDPLDQLKAQKWLEAKERRRIHQTQGVDTPFGRVDSKDLPMSNSQLKISRAALSASVAKLTGNESWTINWIMADNSEQTMSADDMILVDELVTSHINLCQQASIPIREAINSATTLEELNSIDLDAGYP